MKYWRKSKDVVLNELRMTCMSYKAIMDEVLKPWDIPSKWLYLMVHARKWRTRKKYARYVLRCLIGGLLQICEEQIKEEFWEGDNAD